MPGHQVAQEMSAERSSLASTAVHALVVIGLVLLFATLVVIRDALLLAFVAIIVATLLDTLASPLIRHLNWPRTLALMVVVLAVVAAFAGVAWLVGAQVQAQVVDLIERLPAAVRSAEERFGFSLETMLGGDSALNGWVTSEALPGIASMGQVVAGALTATVVAVVAGVFIAGQPELYARGLVKLFPRSQHDRVERALRGAGQALRQWLLAQGMAMVAIGLMAGIGAWILGLPTPLAIGLLVGMVEFVPLIGPVIGALPALILAFSESTALLLATLGLFIVIQQVEGNLITPIAPSRADPAGAAPSVGCRLRDYLRFCRHRGSRAANSGGVAAGPAPLHRGCARRRV